MKTKFKIGDRVRIRKELVVGMKYYSENEKTYNIFVDGMNDFKGLEATVMRITPSGQYQLDVDSDYRFTDSMLTKIHDNVAKTEYKSNDEVENLISHMLGKVPKQLEKAHKEKIDKALDEGNKEEFLRLTQK